MASKAAQTLEPQGKESAEQMLPPGLSWASAWAGGPQLLRQPLGGTHHRGHVHRQTQSAEHIARVGLCSSLPGAEGDAGTVGGPSLALCFPVGPASCSGPAFLDRPPRARSVLPLSPSHLMGLPLRRS